MKASSLTENFVTKTSNLIDWDGLNKLRIYNHTQELPRQHNKQRISIALFLLACCYSFGFDNLAVGVGNLMFALWLIVTFHFDSKDFERWEAEYDQNRKDKIDF
jgi:hypothetical protein